MKKRPDYIDPQPRSPVFWWLWGFLGGIIFMAWMVLLVVDCP